MYSLHGNHFHILFTHIRGSELRALYFLSIGFTKTNYLLESAREIFTVSLTSPPWFWQCLI